MDESLIKKISERSSNPYAELDEKIPLNGLQAEKPGLSSRKNIAKMDIDVKAIAEKIQELNELSYNRYKPLVDSIIAEKVSEEEVEYLLEYILDVCHDDRILDLFKRICRRYYKLYPEMITSEILAYKELYED